MKRLAIVIPAYNEKDNLKKLIPQLFGKYPECRLIIIDDNSPDGTATLLSQLTKKYPHLTLVGRSGKLGRGSAVITGFKKALADKNTDYFLEMDADFSHDPKDIDKILAKREAKTIVIGSRYVKGSRIINWPMLRRILSKLANLYTRLLLGIPIHDYTNGLRLYPRAAVEEILSHPLRESGYAGLSETAYLLYKKDYVFCEVATTFVAREVGKSNTDPAEYLKSFLAIARISLSGSAHT